MHSQVKSEFPDRRVSRELSDFLSRDRWKKAVTARKSMDKCLLEYFEKCHEGVLSRIGVSNAQLHEDVILPALIKNGKIDFDRIQRAVCDFECDGGRRGFTSAYSTIGFLRDGIEPYENHAIGESNVKDYLWAIFLLDLARMKKYPMKEYELGGQQGEDMVEIAYNVGWNLLEDVRVR